MRMLRRMGRRHMITELGPLAETAIDLPVRAPTPEDVDALAELMLDAYVGTVDADGSETLDDARTEVAGYFSGASGEPILDHSLVALEQEMPVSAVLVSRHDDLPLIAYVMTAASHKGRGLARSLTVRVLASLHRSGERQAHLWVTRGNVPAERIYEGLGFRDVSG